MKKLKLSGFDLGALIAFGVLTAIGIGLWWYLSGVLQDSVAKAKAASDDLNQISVGSKYVISRTNGKILQDNIDAITTQLDPLIQSTLLSKDNELHSKGKEDPVAWKHDLDDEVHRLTAAAKLHSVSLPNNFYFSFSRYQSQSPSDEQTGVLSKQLIGVEQIANILINAQINGIQAVRRTYEENPHTTTTAGADTAGDGDRLAGFALSSGKIYTAYPFEVDFETSSEHLRPVLDNLIQSPYVFIIRTLSIKNSIPDSPLINDLDRMAGSPAPGDPTQAPTGAKGPQFLFGNSTLRVKIRVDMIEWNIEPSATAASAANPNGSSNPQPSSTGGK